MIRFWLTFSSLVIAGAAGSTISSSTAAIPLGTDIVGQSCYDAYNDTVYATNTEKHGVFSFFNVSTTPVVASVTWNPYAVVAGNGLGPPSFAEVMPSVATFKNPSGVIGWPLHAFMNTVASPTTTRWLGLWVCDRRNHAVRFINFLRDNSVTVVAGNGTAGFLDGIGTDVTLSDPYHIAWGQFIVDASTSTLSISASHFRIQSMLFWTDSTGDCIRLAIPWSSLANAPMVVAPDAALNTTTVMNMTLNVTTFVGECGTPATGSGLAYQMPILDTPTGIAVVNPFATLQNYTVNNMTTKSGIPTSTSVIFCTEAMNKRISMITPMFPAENRFLVVIIVTGLAVEGLTVARVGGISWTPPTGTSNLFSSTVEVLWAGGSGTFSNVSIPLEWNFDTGTMNRTTPVINTSFASTTLSTSRHAIFVPYEPQHATLVIFTGSDQYPLQYYCCNVDAYGAVIPVSDVLPTPLPWNITTNTSSRSLGTDSGTRTGSATVSGGTMTPSSSWTIGSNSISDTTTWSSLSRRQSATASGPTNSLSNSLLSRSETSYSYSSTTSPSISGVSHHANHTDTSSFTASTTASVTPSRSKSGSVSHSGKSISSSHILIHTASRNISTSSSLSHLGQSRSVHATRSVSRDAMTASTSARRTASAAAVMPPSAIAVKTAVAVTAGTSLATSSVAFTASTVVFSLQRLSSLMQQCRQQADPPPWPTNPGQWSLDAVPSLVGLWRASWVWLIALQPIAVAVTSVLMYLLRNVFFCSRYHDEDHDDDHDHDGDDDDDDDENRSDDTTPFSSSGTDTRVVHHFVAISG